MSDPITVKDFEELGVNVKEMTFSGFESKDGIVHAEQGACSNAREDGSRVFFIGRAREFCEECFSGIGVGAMTNARSLLLEFKRSLKSMERLKVLSARTAPEDLEEVLLMLKSLRQLSWASFAGSATGGAGTWRYPPPGGARPFYAQLTKDAHPHFKVFSSILKENDYALLKRLPIFGASQSSMGNEKKFSLLMVPENLGKNKSFKLEVEESAYIAFALAFKEELENNPIIEVPTFVALVAVRLFEGTAYCETGDQPLAADILENTQRLYESDPFSVYSSLECTLEAAKAL